jgi:hypothetical protein
LSTILRALQRLVDLLERNGFDYMLVGGYALPFYGRIRATIDIDIAVAVRNNKEREALLDLLRTNDYEPTAGSTSIQSPIMVIVDRKEGIEMEIWFKPDGVVFDKETLRQRRKVSLSPSFKVWIISPEDFIVNKLARADRGATDEEDVKSILVLQENRLDMKYLEKRAMAAGVLNLLKSIQSA